MSRAESHEVGGEGSEFSELVGGEGTSQENGEAGAGEGLSLRVMVKDGNGPFESQVQDHMVNVNVILLHVVHLRPARTYNYLK
jgi:hypothetical protein